MKYRKQIEIIFENNSLKKPVKISPNFYIKYAKIYPHPLIDRRQWWEDITSDYSSHNNPIYTILGALQHWKYYINPEEILCVPTEEYVFAAQHTRTEEGGGEQPLTVMTHLPDPPNWLRAPG